MNTPKPTSNSFRLPPPMAIRFTAEQIARLTKQTQIDEVPMARHIRRAVDQYLDRLGVKADVETTEAQAKAITPKAKTGRRPSQRISFR